MKILITGGAGFIGHNLSIYLADKGYEVEVLDSLERSSQRAVEILKSKNIKITRMDVRDKKLKDELGSFDAVVHCAAYVDVEESTKRPLEYLNNNVLGTASVAEACVSSGVKRLVFISSAAVYGIPKKLPIREDHPLKPISPYGLSKLLGESIIEYYSSKLKTIVLRLFNVYGPGQSSYAAVIKNFSERLLVNEPPIILGDGKQTRDFIHIKDVCRAIELSLNSDYTGVFNIASGSQVSIEELAHLMISIAGVNVSPIYSSPRPGDIDKSWADITKAKEVLGFEPKVSLKEGLKDVLIKTN
ncbi:MAG: SDR family NAD(P)-dependent oxidoreductase [Thermoproteota archaeon]